MYRCIHYGTIYFIDVKAEPRHTLVMCTYMILVFIIKCKSLVIKLVQLECKTVNICSMFCMFFVYLCKYGIWYLYIRSIKCKDVINLQQKCITNSCSWLMSRKSRIFPKRESYCYIHFTNHFCKCKFNVLFI